MKRNLLWLAKNEGVTVTARIVITHKRYAPLGYEKFKLSKQKDRKADEDKLMQVFIKIIMLKLNIDKEAARKAYNYLSRTTNKQNIGTELEAFLYIQEVIEEGKVK